MSCKYEFDSKFCNVKYIEEDNIVLLTWKGFARSDDYREPTSFALRLLEQNPDSNFIVDARNGFEDDPDDVIWGFSFLLPAMSRTDCKYVVFIVENATYIESEMNMWEKEFGKYFEVLNVDSYEQAKQNIKCIQSLNLET
jgi:hypothetical protein